MIPTPCIYNASGKIQPQSGRRSLLRRLHDQQFPEPLMSRLFSRRVLTAIRTYRLSRPGKDRTVPHQHAAKAELFPERCVSALVNLMRRKFATPGKVSTPGSRRSSPSSRPRSFSIRRTRLLAVPPVRQRRDRGLLRRYAHGPGLLPLPQGGDSRFVGHRVPDAESRHAEKLGERPEADDAFVVCTASLRIDSDSDEIHERFVDNQCDSVLGA